MSADAMLRSLNNTDWRWIEQGRIEGEERDRISGLHNAERRGIAKGKAQGERNKALSAARKLLLMNILTHDQIAQAEELPLEEVEKLAAQLEANSAVLA